MEPNSQTNKLSNQQRLLLKIQQATAKLHEIETAATEPIAIIGIGCRFPGGVDSPDTYWKFLKEAKDVRTEIPRNRWDIDRYYDPDPDVPDKIYVRQGYFLQQPIDKFDPAFFGISGLEAAKMEPSQRLLLEVTWEALENAGISPRSLKKTDTGVYIGQMNNDYGIIGTDLQSDKLPDFYLGIGTAMSMSAGRLAYILGLQGPALFLDTSCSSSLVALHLACQSLRSRESNLALVGGVNLMLAPNATHALCQGRALSPDSRCKTFDASADGFARGEGCGMVVLKRLRDATADNDRILALVKGSAVNHDGPSSGLTVPNQQAQKKVIRQALKNAKLKPLEIDYVECHGTGTSLGDPLEVRAIDEVYCQKRTKEQLLVLGAVKSNIGHLEGAAGIAGLIKVVLALQNEEIPANLHFNQPNPQIDWEEMPLKVPTTAFPWKQQGEKPRLAGISGFGMSGTNAHIILEEAPGEVKSQKAKGKSEDVLERPLHLLTLSAKTETALQELVSNYENYFKTHPESELADICYTANTGRNHFNHRLAVVASNQQELLEKLRQQKQEEEVGGILSGKIPHNIATPKIAFIFTGENPQYLNMGQQLYESQPTFRQALDKCDRILRPELENSLLEVLDHQKPQKSSSDLLDQSTYSQPALFSIEYALFELWQSWGIKPDVLLGQNVGEYVAACVAGVFSLEEALKLIATRGRLMQQQRNSGVIIDTELKNIAQEITYSQPQIPLISNVTGQKLGNEMTSAEYWVNHSWEFVPLTQGIKTLNEEGYEIFLEIGMCKALETKSLQESQVLLSAQTEWEEILETLAQLYIKGVNIDWSGFDRDYIREKVALPTYPFQRERYWIETFEKEKPNKIPENESSLIFNLLNQGDIEGLTAELNQAQDLTLDEKKLLPKFLKLLINQHKNNQTNSSEKSGILEKIEKKPEKDRQKLIINYLQSLLNKILGLDESNHLDAQLGFADMGLNYSLMLELKETLQTTFGCEVSVSTLLDYFNIQELSKYLLIQIFAGGELEEKNETLDLTNQSQQITVESEIKPLYEDAIATAIQETEVAKAIEDELKEITLLLNNEGD
ncbi:MAG: acyltransferase domain-containing protein [Okeania sp. SIO3B5]|uniref:type I polyketide synthase n=1 Tax=Okeania sp. SIO3B5 TaxID=2607811 RepID=UPI0014006315|nr:beta-ketoacyl synthase N-terminal-like domain-containing protein [Okeania sp. SIO3B5]NEO53119.1 acyltransferase domain-containing protein [Okeania sp. SIO3B5]